MAVVSAEKHLIDFVKVNDRDPIQIAFILFFLPSSATYAQGDNAILSGVPTLIADTRRNGKTINLKGTPMFVQAARKKSDADLYMGLKTLAVAGSDITFEVTEGATAKVIDYSTELANGAVPAQSVPFGIYVAFEES